MEEKGRIEAGKRRRRAHESVDRVDRARATRAAAREEAAGRIGEIAEREGITLEKDMRDTRGVNRLREQWRWSLSPAGEREQLVLFNHGKQGEAPDREVGYYDGEEVSREQYTELDEDTGLRHTLEIGGKMVNGIHGATGMQCANTSRSGAEANNASFAGTAVVLEIGGKMVNGIHGATGMQYANTSRSGAEANNASFARTAVVKVSTAGGVIKGQPVLLFAHTRSEGGHKAWGKKGAHT